MKVKLFLALVATIMIFGGSVFAQADPGIADTIVFEMTVDTTALTAVVQAYVFSDEVLVGASSGYMWINDNMTMDSAVKTDLFANGFDLISSVYEDSDIDVTNANKRFVLGGGSLFSNIPADANTRRLWATYYFSLSTWNGYDNDSIVVDSLTFSAGTSWLFVDENQVSFLPIWGGRLYFGGGGSSVYSEVGAEVPETYALNQNYPNPFNPTTKISFDIPARSHVVLTVYNVLGQKVKTLVDEELAPNHYVTEWDGTNEGGAQVSSGVYFYKLQTEDFSSTKKMVLLK